MKTRTKNTVPTKELILAGNATSPGIALGSVYIFRPFSINVTELEVKIDDVNHELEILDNARKKVLEQLEYARVSSKSYNKAEFADIFESQKAFLNDLVLFKEINGEIEKSGLSAAYVVSKILSEKTEYFINLENTFFRDRAFDILDLKQKLIHALLGIRIDYHLSAPSIIVAESLSPTDTVNFNRNLILGFLTDKGGTTSHSAIMARSLRIPSVVNTFNLSAILKPEDFIILDGFSGDVIINPEPTTIDHYQNLKKTHESYEKQLFLQIENEAVTKDGTVIELMANVDFPHEIVDVKRNRADGIGLFRTESLYIQSKSNPTEEQQFKVYKKLAQDMAPRPVVIRTVDLGGDKLIDGFGPDQEENPFLGWRAIRFCLDSPEFFKMQLRAILRASAFGNIRILIPMVCCAHELTETYRIMKEVTDDLDRQGIAYDKHIKTGAMIETPAAAVSARILAKHVDFFSIGTNDLTQYVLAIDRTNNKVARSFNSFHPAVVELIAKTIKAAIKQGVSVSLCGEFGAVPEAIPLLLGMGLTSFSVNPYYLPRLKKIIRALDVQQCKKLTTKVKRMAQACEIEVMCRSKLVDFVPDLEYLN